MLRWLLVLLLLAAPLSGARADGPCDPCSLASGTYRAVAPPGWNGHDKLRLLLFVHGYKDNGSKIAADPNIAGLANGLGFLLVAPDGIKGGWSFPGSPHADRDELAFLHAVVADAEARWPVDRRTVVAGGFSLGASMVWYLACNAPDGFTAFIPFSGGFWQPLPASCPGGPVALRHTHGTHDSMVPMKGRAILNGKYVQGDILTGFTRWTAVDQCPAQPDSTAHGGDLTCSTWAQCGSGKQLQLCLHNGDHSMIRPWLEDSLRWAIAQSPPG